MAYTSSGAKAYAIAHQMQMRVAAGAEHPAHAEHIKEFVDYANNLVDHYYQMTIAYIDKSVDQAADKAVQKAMNDTKVQLQVDAKSAQSAENSIRSIFRNIFG